MDIVPFETQRLQQKQRDKAVFSTWPRGRRQHTQNHPKASSKWSFRSQHVSGGLQMSSNLRSLLQGLSKRRVWPACKDLTRRTRHLGRAPLPRGPRASKGGGWLRVPGSLLGGRFKPKVMVMNHGRGLRNLKSLFTVKSGGSKICICTNW